MRATQRWLRPPTLRTLDDSAAPERHASWLELFFDLVLVVAIAELSHVFVHHPGAAAAWQVAALFCTVFLAWQGFMAYADRFDSDDAPYRLVTFAQMLALLALALQMHDVVEGRHVGFALAFALLRGSLVLQYLRAWRHVPPARPLIARYGGAYAVSVGLWLLSVALPAPTAFWLWAAAVALDLSMPPLTTRLHRGIPTDPAHLPERFGLFTLIVLGELVVSVGAGAKEQTWSRDAWIAALSSFGLCAGLWWLYYERLSGRELPRSAVPIVTFAYAHLPLLGALMFVAAGAAVLIADPAHAAAGAWALCGGAALCVLAMELAQRQFEGTRDARITRARVAGALLWLAWAALGLAPWATALGAMAVAVALVVLEAHWCRPVEGHTLH